MNFLKTSLAAAALLATVAVHATPVITTTSNANTLASNIGGSGITISGATLTNAFAGASGTFTNGGSAVGFDSGIVLTTGTAACAAAANEIPFCSSNNNPGVFTPNAVVEFTELAFDFTSNSGNVFFQYVFASEEYNEFVNTSFNDRFELLLNNVNIALLPNSQAVTIDNVNCGSNASSYRNNSDSGFTACPNLSIDIAYDGLTVVLTASGTVGTGINNFKFRVSDIGDGSYDSAVFIKAGSFGDTNPTPEPGSLALVGAALAGLAAVRRRKA